MHARCSVLIVRESPDGPTVTSEAQPGRRAKDAEPLRILAAFDGSSSATAVIELLGSLPLGNHAALTVLTVLTVTTTLYGKDVLERLSKTWQEYKKVVWRELEAAVATLADSRMTVTPMLIDDGADASRDILGLARELHADIIVLGSTGMSAIQRRLLGSVSARVVDHAHCSVWVVREQPRQIRADILDVQ